MGVHSQWLCSLVAGVSLLFDVLNVSHPTSAVQGSGAGGILALTEIILSDLVPLHERGMYQGLLGSVWSVACTLGPPVVRIT